MKLDISAYVQGCATCQANKNFPGNPKPPSFPIKTKENTLPFETITLDVTYAPARDQRQYVKSHRIARAEDAEEAEEWIKSEDGITEKMTGLNRVYVRYVSAPADDEEQDYAVRAGAMIT